MSRVVLVTGANRGIGAAIAAELTGVGARVHAVGRSSDADVTTASGAEAALTSASENLNPPPCAAR